MTAMWQKESSYLKTLGWRLTANSSRSLPFEIEILGGVW